MQLCSLIITTAETIFGTEIKTQLKVHFSHNFQYMQPTNNAIKQQPKPSWW